MLAVLVVIGVHIGSVEHLYSDPAARGWRWDAAIGNVNSALPDETLARLEADPRISAQTAARYGNVNVDKQSVEVLAFDARGDAPLDVVAAGSPGQTARSPSAGARCAISASTSGRRSPSQSRRASSIPAHPPRRGA